MGIESQELGVLSPSKKLEPENSEANDNPPLKLTKSLAMQQLSFLGVATELRHLHSFFGTKYTLLEKEIYRSTHKILGGMSIVFILAHLGHKIIIELNAVESKYNNLKFALEADYAL